MIVFLTSRREKRESKTRSIKVLDYAMSGPAGAPVCEAFVEALGLKTLFIAFMGKVWTVSLPESILLIHGQGSKQSKGSGESPASDDIAHSLGIVSSLLTNLPSDSASRIRLLAKFVEGEYGKIDKILEIRDAAKKRLKATDEQIGIEKKVVSSAVTILR